MLTFVKWMTAVVGATAIAVAGIAFGRWARDRGNAAAEANAARTFATVRMRDHAFRVEVVRTPAARERGLSGRAGLGQDEGMLFVFDRLAYPQIWMKEMRFSIDLVWIAGGMVVDTTERLWVPPPGETWLPLYQPSVPSLLVLEVPAGTVSALGMSRGDRVAIAFDGE